MRKSLPSFEAVKTCIETRIRVAAAIANVQWESKASTLPSENRTENNNQFYQSNSQATKKKRVNAYHSASKPPLNSNSSTSMTATAAATKPPGRKFECPICHSEGHPLRACERFLAMPSSERKSIITKLQYCVSCLAFNHQEGKCRSSHTCFTCGERHHSLLHMSTTNESIQSTAAHALTVTPLPSVHVNTYNNRTEIASSSQILLATAIVIILDVNAEPHSLRALIDQGSEANFISESAAIALQLPKRPIQAVINGIGASCGRNTL